ncbi:MAG: ATP-binding cassette domain-containing protein, partial [Candidatus Nanopelagicales bacterium]
MSLAAHITTTVGTVTIDAELTCHAGETVALLGPNGAGKSTLLAAIAGLRAIDDGYIHIDSTSVDEPAQAIFLPPEHRRVGVLFQDYLLFPHMTVRQNIAFGPKNLGIASEGEWIAALGLTDLLDHKPNELSGGQAQR